MEGVEHPRGGEVAVDFDARIIDLLVPGRPAAFTKASTELNDTLLGNPVRGNDPIISAPGANALRIIVESWARIPSKSRLIGIITESCAVVHSPAWCAAWSWAAAGVATRASARAETAIRIWRVLG